MTTFTKQVNPATGAALESVANTPEETIPHIFRKAQDAQIQWAKYSFKERAAHILKVRTFLSHNVDRAAEIISSCNGKTRNDSIITEVLPSILSCNWYMKNTEKVLRREYLAAGHALFMNKAHYLEYNPVGVVAIISPWNYPFSIPFGEIIMGLMAGNAILLKVGAPVTLVGKFIEECMTAGGFPDGLFAHIVVSGAKVSKLLFSNGINKIFFTGSVAVGKQLMAEASATLTPLSLELGGKDAMIVCEDADLERAVNCACWAGYQNSGQSCGGVERIYVHRSIYRTFVDLLASKTRAIRHGPALSTWDVDMGSVTTAGQYKIIQEQVDDAVAHGAKIIAQSQAVGDCSKGFFYPATLLTNVTHKMKLLQEENFGPVLPVMAYDTIDEAIAFANDNSMALTGSIHTRNVALGQKIASKLQAGVITINDHLYTHGMTETPWGGWKDSGLGRTHGALGLKEMCNTKCVGYDRISSNILHRNIWWYPMSKDTYDSLKVVVQFLAPESWGSWCVSGLKIVPFALEKMMTPWRVPNATAPPPNYTVLCVIGVVLVVSCVSVVKFSAAMFA